MSLGRDEVWMLTRKSSAHLVKFNKQEFSSHVSSLSNLNNASQNGFSTNYKIGLQASKKKTEKGSKPEYQLYVRGKPHAYGKKLSQKTGK